MKTLPTNVKEKESKKTIISVTSKKPFAHNHETKAIQTPKLKDVNHKTKKSAPDMMNLEARNFKLNVLPITRKTSEV